MNPPEYERDGEWYFHAYKLESGTEIRIHASGIRRERTGVHATVGILYNGQPLDWSNFNVERSEERRRLSKSAFTNLPEVDAQLFTETLMKQAVDTFCFGLWNARVQEYAGELMAGDPDAKPPTPILGKFVVDGGGSIIHAPPGRGKSWVLMAMAVSMDAGITVVWPCEQRRCGIVNLERSAQSMRYRLARVNRALGLDPARPLPFLNARGRSLMDVLDGIRELIKAHDLEVIMLDSISRAGAGKLVADEVANAVIDSLNSLGGAWVALGHSPRGDETHLFGSIHFTAGADVEVRLLSQLANDNMTLGLGLRVEKANDLPTGSLSILALDFDRESGLVAIRSADGKEFPEIVAQRKMSLTDEVVDYLLGIPGGKADATHIASELGRARQNVADVLKTNRFVRLGADPENRRKVLYAVKT